MTCTQNTNIVNEASPPNFQRPHKSLVGSSEAASSAAVLRSSNVFDPRILSRETSAIRNKRHGGHACGQPHISCQLGTEHYISKNSLLFCTKYHCNLPEQRRSGARKHGDQSFSVMNAKMVAACGTNGQCHSGHLLFDDPDEKLLLSLAHCIHS